MPEIPESNAHIGKLTEKMRNKNAFIKFFTIPRVLERWKKKGPKTTRCCRNFILKDKLSHKVIKIFYNGSHICRVSIFPLPPRSLDFLTRFYNSKMNDIKKGRKEVDISRKKQRKLHFICFIGFMRFPVRKKT